MRFGAKASYTVSYDGNGAQLGNAPVDNQQYNDQAGAIILGNTGNLEKQVIHSLAGIRKQMEAERTITQVRR